MAMKPFEIIAHRGIPDIHPENTIPAFERAIELGADSIELDIRLSSDHTPMVFHYFYLDVLASASGAIFDYTSEQLRGMHINGKNGTDQYQIPTLMEVLDVIGGRIGLEIEIKGPEAESAIMVANALADYKRIWDTIEVTSYEPQILRQFQMKCPGIPTDLLFPRSEPWMKLDVVAYMAVHRARLAGARAAHLHPTQLTSKVVEEIRKNNIEIHTWDVNDEQTLQTIADLGIPKICTDQFQQVKNFRQHLMMAN
jgi:glycerophosphoryl diester phosphodiesterase